MNLSTCVPALTTAIGEADRPWPPAAAAKANSTVRPGTALGCGVIVSDGTVAVVLYEYG
jgi:hypothetical protein